MRGIFWAAPTIAAFLMLVLFGCGTGGDDAPGTSPADMVAVSRTMVTLDRLIGEADAEGVAARFAEDAVMIAPGQPTILGRRAIRVWATELLAKGGIETKHEPLEVDAAGPYLIHRGVLHIRTKRAAGDTAAGIDLRYLYVLKRSQRDSLLLWRALLNRGPD